MLFGAADQVVVHAGHALVHIARASRGGLAVADRGLRAQLHEVARRAVVLGLGDIAAPEIFLAVFQHGLDLAADVVHRQRAVQRHFLAIDLSQALARPSAIS
ncbi:hypothetical protein SDC9_150767 [bioreactor metagenome]|uniref:Uncharacterized protein n=1 Tax=bioreactor metagenome TaxID=1076179 RepID=A0A645EP02_9ZZZZ